MLKQQCQDIFVHAEQDEDLRINFVVDDVSFFFFVLFCFVFPPDVVILSDFACFVLSEKYLVPIYFSNNYRKVLQISYISSLTD